MGRWSYSNRTEADYLKKVEIWWLKNYGYLGGWKSGSIVWTSGFDGSESSIGIVGMTSDNYVRLYYTQTDSDGKKEDFDYKVRLTTTPCKYGGQRYWFICPLTVNGNHCGKRVGVLYKAGDYFGCRHCHNLIYSSQKENRSYKMRYLFRILEVETKVEKIREKMKRSFYAGKPTRKMRRIIKLNQGIMPDVETLMKNDKKGIL